MTGKDWKMKLWCCSLGKLVLLAMLVILPACGPSTGVAGENSGADMIPTSTPEIDSPSTSTSLPATLPPSPTMTVEPSLPTSPTIILEPTQTSTPTQRPTATETALPTITPTYAILRGTILEQANCRYGPGAAYLYKYGVYEGYYMDIIGRNETGTWVVVQAIGGSNPCWVKASLIDIKGDVMSVAPTWLPLPESPYYGPLTGVWAERQGNDVILSWNPLVLKAGDEATENLYLVEAWLCTGGRLTFSAIGTWDTILTVTDEPGCQEASHARVYGVEKHGYTAWVNIPWPAP